MPSDIKAILGSDTFYPFMDIYVYAVGSTAGATGMVSRSFQSVQSDENLITSIELLV